MATASDTTTERLILRELATQVRAIADDPEMEVRRRRWRQLNSLRPERPMVLCFPEGAWSEILTPSTFACRDPFHASLEWQLRTKLWWWDHIRDDNTLEPWFDVDWQVSLGDYGLPIPYTYGDQRGSYHWDPPIKDLQADFPRLRHRTFAVDRPATFARVQRVNELFGDLLPVRIRSNFWWTTGLTQDAVFLIGLEPLMWAMVDQPELLHRLMAFLRDDALHMIEWAEKENLLTGNDGGCDYVGSGGVGCIEGLRPPGHADGPVILNQRWGFAESQETVGVSPTMFDEFILPYQIPLLEKFGLNCYGCCEGLEHRIDLVLRHVPRLRRISVAPLANQGVLAEKLAGNYIFSRKPNPAHLCINFNEPAIRDDLRQTLAVAGDQPLELIMKDTHTVENVPDRITRWVKIAYEEVDRYLGS